MRSPHLRHCKSARKGATTVEFAITCSFAFFFFFAALEFSRVAMYRHTVENALYEGARAGIVPGATADKVRNKTRELLAIAGITDATIDVTPAYCETTHRASMCECECAWTEASMLLRFIS